VASVRARITASYGVATLGTVVLFSIIVGFERRSSTRERLADEASATASLVGNMILRYGQRVFAADTLAGPRVQIPPNLAQSLDEMPGYVLVDDSANVVFWSRSVRRLGELAAAPAPPDTGALAGTAVSMKLAREAAQRDLDSLKAAAFAIRHSDVARIVRLTTEEVLLVGRIHDPPLANSVRRVVVGVPTRRIDEVTGKLAAITALLAPLLALLSSVAAWQFAGRAFEPVDRMVDDVAAISDGRSLHRRVVLDAESTDEFGRLGRTVNDMIGRLENSFAALRRFTADASHELRTPLTVIRANVERSMNTRDDAHEQAVALEEALQQVSRMTGLVESLLTLARADEGRFEIVREPVPLEPLVREVAETAAILGEEPGISVKLPVMQPVTVLGDVERLRQLLLNLATNAVKYTQRGGTVEISLESRHDEAIVTVKDDGIGIAAADLPFIFERFWRVDRARTRTEGTGAGLGLAISQWIAQAHDGRIDVLSRLGRGSTFAIVLPAAPRDLSSSNTALTNS
jgi:two-component system OmpR family sensor kinase